MGQLIILPRGGGKSTELAEWVKEGSRVSWYPYWDRIILVPNLKQEEFMRNEFKLDPKQVFCLRSWRERSVSFWPDRVPEIGIDNVDMILRDLVGHNIAKMTLTGEPNGV